MAGILLLAIFMIGGAFVGSVYGGTPGLITGAVVGTTISILLMGAMVRQSEEQKT
jgi:energy-converting hydrogenase Eha subunit E